MRSTGKSVKLLAIGFLCAVVPLCVHAQAASTLGLTSISRSNIVKAVENYAHGVACEVNVPAPMQIGEVGKDVLGKPEYAVLWAGDIGCQGGNGTSTENIAIVKHGGFSMPRYYVDPRRSSPEVSIDHGRLDLSTRILSSTANSIRIESKTFGPHDSLCCPSLKILGTLVEHESGNWVLINKKVVK